MIDKYGFMNDKYLSHGSINVVKDEHHVILACPQASVVRQPKCNVLHVL